MRRRTLLLSLTATLLFVHCWAWADLDHRQQSADQSPSDVASTWFEALYDVVKAEQTTPPAASRIYGITAIALYESIVAGTEGHRPLVGQLNGLTALPQPKPHQKYHWPTVANAVLANTIRGLYETISEASLESINRLERRFASQQQAGVAGPEYERSVAHGQAVATAILDWAATDGLSIDNNCPYVLVSEPGAWEPTPPLFNPNPLQPCWGLLRPMVLTSGEECSPPGPPPSPPLPPRTSMRPHSRSTRRD